MIDSTQNNGGDGKGNRKTSLIGEPLLLSSEDRATYGQLLAGLSEALRPSDSLEALFAHYVAAPSKDDSANGKEAFTHVQF